MRRKKGWMNLKIVEIKDETWDTKTFCLIDSDDNEHSFDYFSGQYLTFRFDGIEPKPLIRSYTMSSSPMQKSFSACTVKRVENGIVSNWMCDNLKVGDILKARGPIGKFIYDPKSCSSHLVMVGAGSGITPFVSIVREYAHRLESDGAPQKMTLLAAFKSKRDLICSKELQNFTAIKGFKLVTTLTQEQDESFWAGRPSPEMLDRLMENDYHDTTFMTCGPEKMMEMVVSHVLTRGVAKEHAMTESFL